MHQLLFFLIQLYAASRVALFESRSQALQYVELLLRFPIPRFYFAANALNAPFNGIKIGEHKL
ncbi:hypothetical protein, partial [Frankia sp. Mgl5]|uniref:hypothetical protein n=1 Tax=Frankia sp. Mgl5 TaxID=2933793 RepID=UPI00200C4FC9